MFRGINLQVKRGEFLVAFGPNGSGKTTLLNILAGLEKYDSGNILTPSSFSIGFVFQNYREALLPWYTVAENIAFPLRIQRYSQQARRQEVEKLVKVLNTPLDLTAYPYELSGGQQQMVAILRGLITKPDLLLLDEPFSSLDYKTTLFMETTILNIWEKLSTTIFFVTHNIDEAAYLSDRIVMFREKPNTRFHLIENPLPRPRDFSMLVSQSFSDLRKKVLNQFIN